MSNVLTFVFLFLATVVVASLASSQEHEFPEELSSIRTIEAKDDIAAVDRQRVPRCGQFCTFRLCNFNGESFTLPKAAFTILHGPNTASLPYICKPGSNIGMVKGSLEARVFFRGNFVPISRFSPPGLTARFPRNFIKTTKIPFLPWSGISRVPTQGNQWNFLHDRCMIMPVTKYEEIDPNTQLPLRIVNTGGTGTNCVAFRTTAPAIQVELLWDSGDDFDLAVTEPDGDVIDFNNKRSEAGKLNGDNNVGFCDSNLEFGKENVVYFPGGPIETGTYTVKVTHFTKCGNAPTVWRLGVAVDGAIVVTKRGVASQGGEQVVLTTTFRHPWVVTTT